MNMLRLSNWRSGLSAATLLLAFVIPSFAATSSADQWLHNYYQKPAPERFSSAVLQLSQNGFFDQEGHVPLAIGFIATVFAQNPDKVESWLALNRDLPVAHQRILIAALWYSGNAKGSEYLRSYSRECDPALRSSIETMMNSQPSLKDAAVLSKSSLNLQWGVFLANGDGAPVHSILAALGNDNAGTLGRDVRWSLAQNAVQHERVLEICRNELSRQPNAVRETLRAVILDAETKHTPASS